MDYVGEDAVVKKNETIIWEQVKSLEEKPIYPAIVQKVLITAHEEEYFYHDLDYEEKYTEWLELSKGFIVGQITDKSNLLGIGDAIILDLSKHVLMHAPMVTRCGLVLPLISYQGYDAQPKDVLTYFENILACIKAFQQSAIKKSLRC